MNTRPVHEQGWLKLCVQSAAKIGVPPIYGPWAARPYTKIIVPAKGLALFIYFLPRKYETKHLLGRPFTST